MVMVSQARLEYLLKCEREVESMQTERDLERQQSLNIIDWAEGINRQNTSLLNQQKRISRIEAKRTKYLVNRRLGRVEEI